jgi:uncharacterized protein YrrD
VSRLLRASEIIGHPVITLDGESELEVRDVVFAAKPGTLLGFTLRRPGFLGKPVRDCVLPWEAVHGVGRDAVMVTDDRGLVDEGELAGGDDVIGSKVLTDDGTVLGEVVDVIVEVLEHEADVVGFEVHPSEALGEHSDDVFLPLPSTIAMSGEHVMVPDGTREYVTSDLTGFGGAVERFRDQIEGKH